MIEGLKPYDRYKLLRSGGLSEIPRSWSRRRLKTLFREVDERSTTGREKLLSLRMRHGLVGHHEAGGRPIDAASLVGFKRTVSGQLVMNRMRAAVGLFAITPEPGLVSPDYAVFDSMPGVNAAFFVHLFQTPAQKAVFRAESKGLGTGDAGFLRLYTDRFGVISVALPPPAEQAAIVKFIDYADRRIRRYIAAKQKLIKLLQEQKQAIIHQAVTRGLDPDVRLKPSGVEWLGDVPEHWDVRRFVHSVVERADYRGATPQKTERGVFLVTAKNVRRGWIDYERSEEFIDPADYNTVMRRGLPKVDDLLFTTEAPLGHAALVDRTDIAFAQRVIRFRPDLSLFRAVFLLKSVLSPYFQSQLIRRATGSTAQGIKASKLSELRIVAPPLAEQSTLLQWIDGASAPLLASTERALVEIDLLREYRTRLISDVVTGKLDVRQAAANLPDESDLDEPEIEVHDEEPLPDEESAA